MSLQTNSDQVEHATPWFIDRIKFTVFGWHISKAQCGDLKRIFAFDFKSDLRQVWSNVGRIRFESRKWSAQKYKLSASYNEDGHEISVNLVMDLNGNRMLCKVHFPEYASTCKKRTLDGNNNLLPSDLFAMSATDLQKRQVEILVQAVEDTLNEIKRAIESKLDSREMCLSKPHVSVAEMELNRDFKVIDAIEYVESQRHRFFTLHREMKANEFMPLLGSATTKNSICLSGTSYKGEREKMYAKTVDRVRIEYTFDSKRIQSLCESNVLTRPLGDSLAKMVETLGSRSSGNANRFNENPVRERPNDAFTVIQKIMKTCEASSDCRVILQTYASEGVIRYSENSRKLIEKLRRRKLVTRTGIGVYAFVDWSKQSATSVSEVLKLLT